MAKLLEKIKSLFPKKKRKYLSKYYMTLENGWRVEVDRPPEEVRKLNKLRK